MQILNSSIFIYLTANWRQTTPPAKHATCFHYVFNYISVTITDLWWIHASDLFTGVCQGFCLAPFWSNCFSLQVFAVRLWLSLNQWWSVMENPTGWPVHMQEYQIVVLISAGSDKLKEKDWSGFLTFLLQVEALNFIPRRSRIASLSPETTANSRCICRWAVWRLKILLFIIVLASHSDTGSLRAVHKPLQ